MFFTMATIPGSPETPNEDWSATTPDLLVVLDGATVRTETGCRHGAAWYARKLGAAILAGAAVRSTPLDRILAEAIRTVAGLHPDCNLSHPGTPSAGVAVVRLDSERLRYFVLGDVTVVLDTTQDGIVAVSDQRISASAVTERREADRHLIGSPAKTAAMVAMKHAELAARGREYWVAAADPAAVDHAITGEVPIDVVRRLAVVTDGAARFVDTFDLGGWESALDAIAHYGPQAFIARVRRAESSDPLGAVYRRNKSSDDATVVYAEATTSTKPTTVPKVDLPPLTRETQLLATASLTNKMNNPQIFGGAIRRAGVELETSGK